MGSWLCIIQTSTEPNHAWLVALYSAHTPFLNADFNISPIYLPGFPGRPGSISMRGRGRGRIPMGGPPGVPPGMPPSGEFPQGIEER